MSSGLEDSSKPHRPAGKLYGKSLIDDLESRKAQMRSKQRCVSRYPLGPDGMLKVRPAFLRGTNDRR